MAFGTLWSRDITPDRDTGIGAWSDREIARAVRSGVTPDDRALHWQGSTPSATKSLRGLRSTATHKAASPATTFGLGLRRALAVVPRRWGAELGPGKLSARRAVLSTPRRGPLTRRVSGEAHIQESRAYKRAVLLPNAMRFSREGAAPTYFLLRRFFRERRAIVGCKRLLRRTLRRMRSKSVV
jgi:hypothetical protein